jgi:lipocalin-like protein
MRPVCKIVEDLWEAARLSSLPETYGRAYDSPWERRKMKTILAMLALCILTVGVLVAALPSRIACSSSAAGLSATPANEELVGTWRLVRFTRTIVATGEAQETFGKAPSGFIQFGRDGRMMMFVVKDQRPSPTDPQKMTDQQRADLFKTMIAYGGTYTFDGKTLTSHLDVTWNQAWTGTDIVRHVMLEGRNLTLTADPHKSYVDGNVISAVMTFEKLP